METTAAGIEADTVIPANKPRYAFAAARIIESKTPRINALIVISGNDLSFDFIAALQYHFTN